MYNISIQQSDNGGFIVFDNSYHRTYVFTTYAEVEQFLNLALNKDNELNKITTEINNAIAKVL